MKKIQGLLSVAGLLMMAASASAGWGSSGGGFGSGGGYAAGMGSTGGYSAGFGSSGGGYSAGGGSSGGYTAGYGSSGGASAGYGSSGGVAHVGPLRRLAASIHSHHANRVALRASAGSSGGGSSGGYHRVSHGSSGGGYSPISYGSSGGHGSSGASHHGSSGGGISYGGGSSGGYSHASYGSTGSSYYGGSSHSSSVESYGSVGSSYDSGVQYGESAPMYSSPSTYGAPAVEGAVSQPAPLHSGALNGSGWSNRLVASSKPVVDADQIQLNVVLPEAATVFVNGNRTKSTGAVRRFVSKDLEAGQSYRFEVRAEREVNGRTVTEQKTIVLVPGSSESIEFALEEKSKAAETVLTLNVPQDAKVVLAGNGTKSVGETRTYRSQELTPGQVWDDYKIIVTWNGQVKEKTIRLIGGDEMVVSFNFDDTNKIAMR